MIVVETSALVAIFQAEPEAEAVMDAIAHADARIIPASCLVEFAMLRRLGPKRRDWLADLLSVTESRVGPIDAEVARIAADAAERYGRGSGHEAQLNFGDCLSYAIARHLEAPLLYLGADFAHTDIESALQ